MNDNKDRDKRIEKACRTFTFHLEWFAPGVAKLIYGKRGVVWDDKLDPPTACTDGDCIRFNPSFFDWCSDDDVVSVIAEEVFHCLGGHLWRAPEAAKRNWKVWNHACDAELRHMLIEVSDKRMASGTNKRDIFPLFRKPEFAPDAKYKGWSAERIFQDMMSNPKNKPGGGSIGDIDLPSQATPEERKQEQDKASDWKSTLVQSSFIGKSCGNLPAAMERLVKELTSVKVNWWDLVAQWLREFATDDYDWSTPNPLFNDADFVMPDLRSERIGEMVFATDTSGSMSLEVLSHFHAEKQNCLDTLSPRKFIDIYWDTVITKVKEYERGDSIEKDAPGGGGTDVKSVFDWIEKQSIMPKCLVILTDLQTPFPSKAPDFPVCWVCWEENDIVPPFGDLVKAYEE